MSPINFRPTKKKEEKKKEEMKYLEGGGEVEEDMEVEEAGTRKLTGMGGGGEVWICILMPKVLLSSPSAVDKNPSFGKPKKEKRRP